VISLGGAVYSGSVRVGGDKFDEAIINYIRRNYGMLIGETTAESIKKEIGSAFPGSEVKEMEVKGRNLAEGIPRSFTISSNEILEALRTPPLPDVALLDIGLPDTNGFDILARMRAHPQLKSIPVIMLTAQAQREDVMRGLAGGADGYITKPFDRDVLLTGIRAVLGLGWAPRANTASGSE